MELEEAVNVLKSLASAHERMHRNGIVLVNEDGTKTKARHDLETDDIYQALIIALPLLEAEAEK